MIRKIINTIPWTYVIENLIGEEIFGMYYEKELQKTNKTELRAEKVLTRKDDKLYVKWKYYNNSLNSYINIKGIIKMSEYFPKPSVHFGKNIKFQLNRSNYATKTDVKEA